MNRDEQLLITGRVINATRKIESKLEECGASGSGLREKTDSLKSDLSDEIKRLIRVIGNTRNRVAHENGATLRSDDLAFFEKAVNSVLAELDELAEVQKSRAKHLQTNILLTAVLPGVHLLYLCRAVWVVFRAGKLYLGLFVAELATLILLGFAIANSSYQLMAAWGIQFLEIYLYGCYLGVKKTPKGRRFGIFLFPGLNLIWFVQKVIACTQWSRFWVLMSLSGLYLVAIKFCIDGEYIAAGITAMVSWLGTLFDAFIHYKKQT
ncbi:MAG: hypothetical protein LBM70_10655 [Victivallales bacterium]|jgi:hypothetical protein|nr:hypothetical protein [Victivallales bacterium]